jgi:hypothetical protein
MARRRRREAPGGVVLTPRPSKGRDDLDSARRAEVQGLVERGELLAAHDALIRAPDRDENVWLLQRRALVLCELRDPLAALAILEPLREVPIDEDETLGLIGRARKDLALLAPEADRGRLLARAHDAYREAFERLRAQGTECYWHGVSAAATAFLRGDASTARALADQVERLCRPIVERRDESRRWVLATLGELDLLRGRIPESLARYSEAGAEARDSWRQRKSMRRDVRLILEHAGDRLPGASWEAFDRAVPVPRVGICVGHLVDRPGRPAPRFPAANAERVSRALDRWIAERGVGFGFVSGAAGADLLFDEAVRARGGESHLLLPYDAGRFLEESVAYAGPEWVARFRTAVEAARRARRLSVASHTRFRDGVGHGYVGAYLEGLGILKAEFLGVGIERVAVWDGRPGDGPGGTAATVRRWRRAGVPFHVIDPARPDDPPRPSPPEPPDGDASPTGSLSQVRAFFFADAHGFSGLSEEQMDLFGGRFLAPLGEVYRRYRDKACVEEHAGDSFFCALEDVGTAGRFALDAQDRLAQVRWEDAGLPADLGLRIALHAGPVRITTHEITGRPIVRGASVPYGARIEPVTPRGHVYASEAFAALAAAEPDSGLACPYAGVIPWAKGFGEFPTYRVVRARPAAP